MGKVKSALENEIISMYEDDFLSPEEISSALACDIEFVLDTLGLGGQ